MKVRPLGDRVLISRIAEEETMRNGLYIPDAAKEKPQEGLILGVGPDVKDKSLAFGGRILFGKYSGTEIKIDSQDLLILREEEILGVLEN